MKPRLLSWLCCPACRHPELRLEARRSTTRPITTGHFEEGEAALPGVDLHRRLETEVIEGALSCSACGRTYLIREGIPRLMVEGSAEGAETAHKWTTFRSEVPEWEQSFLECAAPLQSADFLGLRCLDVGCGYGRHAFYAARFGAEVIGIDHSTEALKAAATNTESQTRVHLIQADAMHLPIRDGAMDLALAFGLLHHLEDPEAAFRSISATLRAGGRLSTFVYGARQGLTLQASKALRGVTTGLEAEELHKVSQGIAAGLRVFSHTPYRIMRHVPVASSIVRHLPVHDHHKWPFDVVVADVFDRLRIPVKHWFNEARLDVMYREEGYADVHVTRRVGNNETFAATGVRR